MVAQFAEFARENPAWTHDFWSALFAGRGHRKGMPLSWRCFRAGMEDIARAHAQQELRLANAARMAQVTDQNAWIKYTNRLRTAAGFTR